MLYESKDVTITILVDPEDPVEVMLAEAKEKINKEVPKPKSYCFSGNYNYGRGNAGIINNKNPKPVKPIKNPQETFPGMTRELYEDIMADPYGFY